VTRTCAIIGCQRPHAAKGYCNSHYVNVRRHGSPVVDRPRGQPLWESLLARLPNRPPGQCWIWGGTKRGKYGSMKWDGQDQSAHRLMFFAVNGYWPVETRHTCDVPMCCNPAHLLPGDRQSNVQDRVDRHRSARLYGRDNPNARYTNHQIEQVLALLGQGVMGCVIAQRTGVGKSTVSRIKHGQR